MKKSINLFAVILIVSCSCNQKRLTDLELQVESLKYQLDSVTTVAEENIKLAQAARDSAVLAYFQADSAKAVAIIAQMQAKALIEKYEK